MATDTPVKSEASSSERRRRRRPQQMPASASFFGQTVKWSLITLVLSVLLSKSLTSTYSWGYKGKWIEPSHYLDTWHSFTKSAPAIPKERLFTEAELSKHTGKDPKYPTYIAIDGDGKSPVYDVSSSKAYSPGGSYDFFAGIDAARAYVTGCFDTHLTHDLRGLTEKQLGGLTHWKEFFSGHETYKKVGRVLHAAIDPTSPEPAAHC
ncbi:BZ3500_MvSof-1268-A1-R1_Chr3-1g05511 [Microbotryum saponariae]|uniref:BZ3500_MvSof-1268-A1-R1_Chr3-1g05511 protein n=1 Tax=Microbotryum saponariae TaxID=289078 RepID=A0A2X0KWK3_9BASI|nr:BZ3500_MvSof-1268-A1-R1_Chr3-1g05511 [Microbotryum saponariae]SDA04702.1 BZ3501_MvSof-1269-A2-R1_Chr3-1g05182 [Microbotryum saponariae]